MKNCWYSIYIALLFTWGVVGQTKFEKESRINENKAPEKAKMFIIALDTKEKVKWYKEESSQGESIEAKFKYKNKDYSVEFDVEGNLQDVEKLVNWELLPDLVKNKIDGYLKDTFKKYRIIKIQEQYIGETKEVLETVLQDEVSEGVEKNYEIVLKGINKEGRAWYEYTFTGTGAYIQNAVLVFKNTDNLEF